jgi:hypothetical protein
MPNAMAVTISGTESSDTGAETKYITGLIASGSGTDQSGS